MNKKILGLLMGAFLSMGPSIVLAHEGHDEVAVTTEGASTGEVIILNNKICPISNEPVGSMGPAYEVAYNGKTYKLCCEMCAKEFMKDPVKYSKTAEAEIQK